MEDKTIALYPGCSLETSARNYLTSIEKVFNILGVDFFIMEDWNCCGATSVKSIDQHLNLALNFRNLSLAEEQGIDELVVPCASCYHRLVTTEFDLSNNKNLIDKLTHQTGYTYKGKVKVRNILDFLVNIVGLEKIKEKVIAPLTPLTVACYYGCLNTRIPKMKSFDIVEYPMSMDHIIQELGANTVDWSYKTECCGASMFMTQGSIWSRLVGRILKDASHRKVDCLTVSCPMCYTNIDTKQKQIRNEQDIEKALPVPFVTQLMGLAYGCTPGEVGLDKNFEILPEWT